MKITNGIFVLKLIEIINRSPAGYLLTIPGVYELVSEKYNNAVLEELEEEGYVL